MPTITNALKNKAQQSSKYANTYLYLYCLTIGDFNYRLKSNGILFGTKPELYNFNNIVAVISKIKPSEFNKKYSKKLSSDLNWTKENISRHHQVISEIFKTQAVIPLKFLNIIKDENGLKKLLLENFKDYTDLLDQLKNQEEWGIKLFLDINGILKEENEKKEIQEFRREIKKAGEGKKWYLEKKLEEILKNSIDRKVAATAHEFENFLFENSKNYLFLNTPNEAQRKRLISSATILLDKETFKKFNENLKKLFNNKKNISYEVTGPWPPYSFVEKLINNGK